MIEATIKFTKNLTNVSIIDYVADGKPFCKDEHDKPIDNHTGTTANPLKFVAQQYDGTLVGYVIISGNDGKTPYMLKKEDLKNKEEVAFPLPAPAAAASAG